MALLEFFKSNREIVLAQTIQQVVSNAGDGNLRDDGPASRELRQFLRQVPSESLFSYARHCLENSFPKSGSVLQDLVNEFGRRLDFDVVDGLYQGRRNAIGFDGIWRTSSEPELIIEVKTTDTYSIRLETMYEYREALIADQRVSKDASILIVVGREDTGALEAQVRGSRYAWDIRLISVERLIKLVQIKEKSDDPTTAIQIRQLLHPFEYTKVDRIIDVIFTTTADVESQQDEAKEVSPEDNDHGVRSPQSFTDPTLLDSKRQDAATAFGASRSTSLLKRSRTSFWTADKQLRVCCTVSKRYDSDYQPYWYAYHPKWDEFLAEADGYLILVMMDLDHAFAIPQSWLAQNLQHLNTTERPDGKRYWHIALTTQSDGTLAINLTRVGKKYPLEPHRFQIG